MKIDFEEIKELLQDGNLAEVSRQTGIAYRTLQDWKLGNNKWLKQAEERLSKLQKYIKMKMEESKMKKYAVVVNLEDKNGRVINVNFDALVEVAKSIEDVESFIDDDKDSSSYSKAEKITYAIYEVTDEILADENDEFGEVLEMGTNIAYELNRDEYGEFRLEIEFTNEMRKEVIEEAMESIGSTLNLAVYSDGSTALVDQNTQVREEFDGEIERICTLNLSPEYWQDTFEENELDMYDFTIEDLKEKELYDEIYESFEIQIDSYLNN